LQRTRIILSGLPRMLGEIIRELVRTEPDLCIVGEYRDRGQALEAIERKTPDVVITGLERLARPDVADLLGHHPAVRVLAVSADGSESYLYELRPHERMLGEVSPRTLLTAIRRTTCLPST
jgi:DNA-binding NarL/FixJ family response regulator